MDTGRLTAWSDGIFAIAATLLVLNLHVPSLAEIHASGLWSALLHQGGGYLSFILSFLLVGLVWINHHTMLSFVTQVKHGLLVALLPFPTAVLAEAIGTPDQQIAVLIYAAVWCVGGVAFNGVWWQARRSHLLDPQLTPAEIQRITRRFLLGPILYALMFGVGWVVHGTLSLIGFGLLAMMYLLPQRAVRLPRERRTLTDASS